MHLEAELVGHANVAHLRIRSDAGGECLDLADSSPRRISRWRSLYAATASSASFFVTYPELRIRLPPIVTSIAQTLRFSLFEYTCRIIIIRTEPKLGIPRSNYPTTESKDGSAIFKKRCVLPWMVWLARFAESATVLRSSPAASAGILRPPRRRIQYRRCVAASG